MTLDELKAVRRALDVKVNDVVLAVCAGALRSYLIAHDELPDGRTVAQSVVDAAAAVNAADPGLVGVVVGATLTEVPDVSDLGGPVLVPGVGAQGGRPEALAGLGGARPGQLLPAVSREVLRAGPEVAAVRAAAERLRDAVAHLA